MSEWAQAALGSPPHSYAFDGMDVMDYLDHVEESAVADFARKHPDAQGKGLAGGLQAKPSRAKNLAWAARALGHCPGALAPAVQKVAKSKRRGKPVIALSLRAQACLERVAESGETEFIRAAAGAWAGAGLTALRTCNMQRSKVTAVRGPIVYGVCDLDAKLGEDVQNARPLWTSAHGVHGTRAWLDAILASAPPEYKATGSMPPYFFRANNAPENDGEVDLARATAYVTPPKAERWGATHGPETSSRAIGALRWILRVCGGFDKATARLFCGHSPKKFLPTVGRSSCMPKPQINEIGAWSGSESQAVAASSQPTSNIHASNAMESMGDVYSAEGAEAVVPAIMEAAIGHARNALSTTAEHQLPMVGGWGMLAPSMA
jgi:hypothetical protein